MPPATPSAEFAVTGMNCQGCVRHVADAIESVPGVESAVVDLASARATVRWKSGATPANDSVTTAVKAAGYTAQLIPLSATRTPHSAAAESWRASVLLGATATIPLMIGEWVFGLGMERWWHWVGFALALPTQVFCGGRFYRGAWRLLKAGGANMDTLVALGSTTAFGYSVFGLFAGWHTHLYFMEAASIITVVSAGHWMESLASAKAASALRALLNLAPQTARKLDAAGTESEVPVASLRADDRVALRPGDRVPVDGDVIEGASAVDEAMLTGESLPVEKAAGAKLFTGTVNQNGRLVMRVTATGESTALAHIISVVQRAQASRANIQKLGDRVSAVFVPVVAVVAIATGLWWGLAFESAKSLHTSLAAALWMSHLPDTALAAAFIHAAAVLIVACPCAMGLATPAAIMAGTNAAARRGILIRDGLALEKCGTITAVLFDKTGTLTQGKLAVAATHECGPPGRLATLATALAGPSNHPLSRAVATGLTPTDEALDWHEVHGWREIRGSGVEMILDDEPARLGSPVWLRECGVDFAPVDAFASQWAGSGATVLGVSRGNKLIGAVALRDALKSRAGEVVRELTADGRRVCLVTGDNSATARAIAAQAGIAAENVFAEVRPERKAEIVRELQSRGERVAFVGDGINDAPALEQADLGVAVSRASDVAREAADIVLLRSDIEAVPEALGLAQATLRTIKQNLFWAFFYNAATVPLAALGFISPILCAAAMGASDVVVIGNALRLARWKR